MTLVASPRHSDADRARWELYERQDQIVGGLSRIDRLTARAHVALRAFHAHGPFYVGVSWGKDSTVVAHMTAVLKLDVPVLFFPAGIVENPDCGLVRDDFLRQYDVRYSEHPATELRWTTDNGEPVHDGAQEAFVRETRKHGQRYASGIRAEESGPRQLRVQRWGENSPNTCAPLARWTIGDVYAYLARHGLPVHPAYGCTRGGLLEREWIRVGTIGGMRGTGMGRRDWEQHYYPEVVREVRRLADHKTPNAATSPKASGGE